MVQKNNFLKKKYVTLLFKYVKNKFRLKNNRNHLKILSREPIIEMGVLEETVMVNSINNDAGNFKRVDVADNSSVAPRPQPAVKRESYLPETSNVSLSNASKEISALKELVSNAPDVDANRVDDLKKEIESGHYQIDSKAIASRMITDLIKVD
ncbi:flagellar biosynthesis anti-sigma factor FlgM [Legionella dresdenensis]|uniref:Negative regulator of flagellin synthesis n=1 Tax=Legionella dresdenensis TaxID=450200 RepID=A0ABV8CBY3_9GAMM